MFGAAPVYELFLRLEGFTPDAVPSLVHTLVNVAGVVDPLNHVRDGRLVPRLGRPDEVVVRQIERTPRPLEDLFHPIAVRERIQALLRRTLVDILRVLVVAHEKERVNASQTLIPSDDVGAHLLVGGPQMRTAVHVIDCGCDVEARHADVLIPNPQSLIPAEIQIRLVRRGLHVFDGHMPLGRNSQAVFELRRRVDDRVAETRDFEADRHRAAWRRRRSRARAARAEPRDIARQWSSFRETRSPTAPRAVRAARESSAACQDGSSSSAPKQSTPRARRRYTTAP